MSQKYLLDTNVLLNRPDSIQNVDGIVVVPYTVLQELDKIKSEMTSERSYKARLAVRMLKSATNVEFDAHKFQIHQDGVSFNNDDLIVDYAKLHGLTLMSGDLLMQLKAKAEGIECVDSEDMEERDEYSGIHELFLDPSKESDQEAIACLYERESENTFGLIENQYLIAWDLSKPSYDDFGELKGYEPIDKFKWKNGKLTKLKYKPLESFFAGKIKPRNVKQELLFDMLQDDTSTVKACFGEFGVGKDFCMLAHAINLLENRKTQVDKIVWVRNNIELKDTKEVGFLPGTLEEKLSGFVAPLADHLGGQHGLEMFLRDGKIEIQHLGTIRGRDIKNSIIYVTEVQNNTREHIKLLLGRVGEGSQLWLNGDLKQSDSAKFQLDSGLKALKDLGGNSLYGQVTLDKTERSETAKLAKLL